MPSAVGVAGTRQASGLSEGLARGVAGARGSGIGTGSGPGAVGAGSSGTSGDAASLAKVSQNLTEAIADEVHVCYLWNHLTTADIQAHALSAEASSLVDSVPTFPTFAPHSNSSNPGRALTQLQAALEKYQSALSIYETSLSSSSVDARKTIELLVMQHRRLVRDIERRIGAVERAATMAATSATSGVAVGKGVSGGVSGNGSARVDDARARVSRRATEPVLGGAGGVMPDDDGLQGKGHGQGRPVNGRTVSVSVSGPGTAQTRTSALSSTASTTPFNGFITRTSTSPPDGVPGLAGGVGVGVGVGLASLNRPSIAQPGIASRASFSGPSSTSNTTRGIPPFAHRPVSSTSNSTSTYTFQPSSSAHPGTSSRLPISRIPPLSPLYSSSTSSDTDPAESFVSVAPRHRLGAGGSGGTEIDPFSRFWGMLEGCLDEMSRPVAFASAPIGRRGVDLGALEESLGERGEGEGGGNDEVGTGRVGVVGSESVIGRGDDVCKRSGRAG